MKLFITILMCLLLTTHLRSQTDSTKVKDWTFSGTPGVNFSQNSFTNWVAGGSDLSALSFDAVGFANYKKDKIEWNNSLNLGYGLSKQQAENSRKTIDKIDFITKLSVEGAKAYFRYSASINLKSQFTDGYDYQSNIQWYLTSSFFAPGYITGSIGIDYIGTKNLNIHFAPLSEKTTIVREKYYDKKVINEYYDGYEPEFQDDDEQFFDEPSPEDLEATEERLDSTEISYGLNWRENSRIELGLLIQAIYSNEEIIKNVGIKSRLDIFAAYGNFTEPDIDWEVWLSFKFNKNIAFNINPQLIYDSDIQFEETDANGNISYSSKAQFRNSMSIGVSYTFN